MQRDIIKIDEDLCTGCALCIPNCHEGALQMIDGKARLISDLMCDGLGACIGHCPEGAITIERREAAAYNEPEVMRQMIKKGKATVIAHLKHLKDHNETDYVKEGLEVLRESHHPDIDVQEIVQLLHADEKRDCAHGGCPGSQSQAVKSLFSVDTATPLRSPSELQQWPVQMHLINPSANFFKKCDLLLAADCVAFSTSDFHQHFLKGKMLAIACPKLDSGKEIYLEKLARLIDEAEINTITVMLMEVPCCGGLLQIVQQALATASRKVPVKRIIVSISGEVVSEEWV